MRCAEWKPYDPKSTTVSSRYFDGSSDWVSFDQTLGVRSQSVAGSALGSPQADRDAVPCLLRGPSLADWSAELLHCRCMTQSRSTCGSSGTASRATTPSWYACHSTQSLDVDREASPLAAQNEDNWDVGDLHYQIYNSLYGFDVHRRPGTDDTGDYTFKWQPSAGLWYFLSVSYLSTEAPNGPFIRLSVDDQWVEDSNTNGDPIRGPVRAKPPQVTTIRGVSGVLS